MWKRVDGEIIVIGKEVVGCKGEIEAKWGGTWEDAVLEENYVEENGQIWGKNIWDEQGRSLE